MTLLAIVGLLYAAVRGLYQGIIMHQPGPREHWWFQFYHRTMFADAVLAAWFGILLDRLVDSGGWFPGWAMTVGLAGLFLAAWETFEVVYAMTRFGEVFMGIENVFGCGKNLTGRKLQALHLFRIVAGTILLLKGGAF